MIKFTRDEMIDYLINNGYSIMSYQIPYITEYNDTIIDKNNIVDIAFKNSNIFPIAVDDVQHHTINNVFYQLIKTKLLSL